MERAYAAPIVPLYLCYAITHIVPMTIGFGNFFSQRIFGRRIYQDHYESPLDTHPNGHRLEAGK